MKWLLVAWTLLLVMVGCASERARLKWEVEYQPPKQVTLKVSGERE